MIVNVASCDFIDCNKGDGSFKMLPWQYGRIRCLYSGKTSLQSYSKHRVVPQLVEPVVVVSELLDQHLPAVWIQKILRTERKKHLFKRVESQPELCGTYTLDQVCSLLRTQESISLVTIRQPCLSICQTSGKSNESVWFF